MNNPLTDLEPSLLWKQFSALASVPRPSGHEELAAAYIRDFAAENGLEVVSDETGNLLVRVPATPGKESAPVVVIQNHIDMVGEKNKDVEHDFVKDPISPRIEGEWVYGTGTTLGADNGIGAAAALAVAVDPDVVHGPLELLFTIDEESGLTGAKGLDASMISGRTMLNLDSEEDGAIYIGCAGGRDALITLEPSWTDPGQDMACVVVEVGGLRGGHSGLDVGENRGNAVKLLARTLLAALGEQIELRLASLTGGDKHNAIPREAEARIFLSPSATTRLRGVVADQLDSFRTEHKGTDDGLEITISESPTDGQVLVSEDRDRLLRLLAGLPHGVLAMSNDLDGLVETSSNLAAVKYEEGRFTILTSSRSSIKPALDGVLSTVESIGLLAGADVEIEVGYPGWKPNMDSEVLQVVKSVYARLWQKPPAITAIHAGLECGLIGEKVPGMDMVSFGPQIEGAHSPEERVNIPSVGRFWNALRDVLEQLSTA